MVINVRVAAPDDIDVIKALTVKLVKMVKQTFVEKRFEWGIQRRLYDPLQKHGILVATDSEKNDQIIGVIFAELRVDPWGSSEGYIKNFIVDDAYRGKGVGKLLLKKSIEHLKNISVEKVMVNLNEDEPETSKAAKLYDEFGFKKKYSVLELKLTD
ncbi:MAG: GNAT family N-acetyltransferase [Promethearchaeota archaeon]